MAPERIPLPEDVYERLEAESEPDESLGETIDRLLESRQLSEFWGAWGDDTAAAAREAIDASRERSSRVENR